MRVRGPWREEGGREGGEAGREGGRGSVSYHQQSLPTLSMSSKEDRPALMSRPPNQMMRPYTLKRENCVCMKGGRGGISEDAYGRRRGGQYMQLWSVCGAV